MKLYNFDGSPNCFRVRLVIEELGFEVEQIEIDLSGKHPRPPDFLAVSPGGKVPAFVDDDGFSLFESRAINAYLAQKRPDHGLYPADPRRRALVDQWSYWQAIHLGPAMQAVTFERVSKAAFHMGTSDEAVAAAKLQETNRFLQVLEAGLAGKEWLVDTLTIADLAVASTFPLCRPANISLASFPAVAQWIDRVEARPSWSKALPAYVREILERAR
jgi:glutathione S-transferase